MSKLSFGRGYVYHIQYHIVWCVKYRKKILTGEIGDKIKELIKEIAEDNEFSIIEMETNKDHIHLLINCKPQHYIPNIMKALKGVSSRKLFMFYPELKNSLWGGHLWNPSYFVSTVSENTEDEIKEYISKQEEK